MLLDSPFWHDLMFIIGEFTVLFVLGMFVFSIILVAIAFYSIEKRRFYFPRVLKSGLVLTEGFVKAICKLFSLDDKELTAFYIKLHNSMNASLFESVPVGKRAIFLPQCLRSSQCPAHLTPEGLECRNCGRCMTGEAILKLREMGYMVFLVPGSTVIKRMVKKYHPEAIIGVGCLMEVKEGIELLDRIGLIGMGVVTLKDGCVETIVDWQDVFDVAAVGIQQSAPCDLDITTG